MKKKILFVLTGLGFSLVSQGQVGNLNNSTTPVQEKEPPIDGYVIKSDVANRKVIPYAPIRQTDVAFSKRVWREIDLREKMNQAFGSPKARLMDIIVEAIKNGELTAYDPTSTKNDPNGDSFKNILPIDQVLARLGGDSVLVEQYNENNEVVGSHYEKRDWSGESVLKFRIKEDWIFDKQRSVFEPRIIGIAPLITPQIPGVDAFSATPQSPGASNVDPFDPFAVQASGEVTEANQPPVVTPVNSFGPQVDATPAFWIYFPEARHVLVNKEVVNRNSDATGLSYDDVFMKRLFSSYIIKQSNPDDLRIKDYITDDIDRLLESERIKKALMDYEQDLWSY
ncbi:type IX secretion system ring subunit PorN/GldN [Sphingobacterium bovistauri]|uniref:Gliding motility protein GldN n=1 Tax=Sphingobacterium bovistauri TaxID=2781959 RepID=A0ABS7Z4P2_9SPHI|nr:gliding motility protein GldN [Sphingobacterium bovistauri]MCA5004361.1 gliding motility protein GldN [Sphingobacterium bovistauri]